MTNEPETASSGSKPAPRNPTKPREEAEKYDGIWMPRRDFFSKLNWVAFLAAVGGVVAATVRLLYPKVLFEPPKTFKAGYPEEYGVGEVSERWKRRHRIWIIRTGQGLFALSAKCTHL